MQLSSWSFNVTSRRPNSVYTDRQSAGLQNRNAFDWPLSYDDRVIGFSCYLPCRPRDERKVVAIPRSKKFNSTPFFPWKLWKDSDRITLDGSFVVLVLKPNRLLDDVR